VGEPSEESRPTPWYQDGLRFECTRCGNCCTGAPGSVRIDEEEAQAMAAHLGLDWADFQERCTRLLEDGSTALTERADHDCVFWSKSQGCLVYPVRPRQCRTWPFWRRNLASPAHWAAAAEGCPGIGRGPLHDAAAIGASAAHDGTSGTIPALDAGSPPEGNG